MVLFVARHWRSAFAQHVASAPDGFDEVFAFSGVGQLLAQLTNKHVDNFEFRLIHATIEVVEEHFFGECGAFAKAEKFQHLIFFAGEVHTLATHFNCFSIKVHQQFARENNGLGMALRTADNCVDAGHQFILMERLGHIIISAEAKTLSA